MVRRHGTLDGARCSTGCGDTVRLAVQGARKRGTPYGAARRSLYPYQMSGRNSRISGKNSGISAANLVRMPAPRTAPKSRTCTQPCSYLDMYPLVGPHQKRCVSYLLKLLPRFFDSSVLRLFASSILRFFASSILQFFGSSILRFFNSSLLRFFNSSILRFFDSSILQFFDSSILRFFNSSILRFFESSILRFFDFAILRFFDSSILRPSGPETMNGSAERLRLSFAEPCIRQCRVGGWVSNETASLGQG